LDIQADSPEQFPVELGFRMRGAGISRIDVFSDVVFAFALVLLAVSLTIPKNPANRRTPFSPWSRAQCVLP